MKDRITPALRALADQLKYRDPPFAGLRATIRLRLAQICSAFALMDLVADENARDHARAVLGALHAAAMTSDDQINDEEQESLFDGCWRALQAAARPAGHIVLPPAHGVEEPAEHPAKRAPICPCVWAAEPCPAHSPKR